MPANPFSSMGKGNNDPLAPSAAGAWGQGSAGFGNKAYGADEYDVVEIEEPAAKTTVKTKGSGSSAPATSSNVSARERELARKEAELQKREAELQRREALARAGGTIDPFSIKNFPPCMPIVHHDISMDIPDGKRSITRQGFMIYLGTVIALTFNLICVIVAWIETGYSSLLSSFFFALIYWLAGIPLGWILWYMRLYRAMMKDGALSFGTFFLMFLVHIAFCIYTAISPGLVTSSNAINYAHAGIITAMKLNSNNETLAFIFYIAGFAWWTFISAVSVFYLFRVYATFRNQGGVQAARQEATIAGVQMVQSDLASGGRNGRGRV